MPAPRTKQLFISYRSSDAVKVDKIARDLGLLRYDDGTPRYTPWQDKHNLPPASPSWWDAIVEAIERCDMFVFHLSRTSLQSEVCRAELNYAYQRNRPIVSVVLDGEFFLDPISGKYDLPRETWALVPKWLGETQFIFYIPTEFYGRFQTAVELFEGNWPRDIPAPRPLNPDAKSVHGNNHALYSAACDYAERLALADAETHFRALVRRNDSDYADLAELWLKVVGAYGELLEMITHNSPALVFNRKWTAYQGFFPNDVLDRVFDPKKLEKWFAGEQERLIREKAEADRLQKQKAEVNRLELEKAEAELLARRKAESERLAREKAESERLAKQKTESDRLIREKAEAELLARQKAESGRLAREKAESERLAKQKTESERLVRENVKANRIPAERLLPQPFAWVKILGGSGMMQAAQDGIALAIPTKTYGMSKYPITNAQYAKFIEEGGYHEKRWWTPDGWAVRQKQDWTQSSHWQEREWNGKEQPVVGLSWFEAVAFCLWLSEATGENIMLPTEAQWQYAAQGKDGRTYPWGNDWDAARCNTREIRIHKTTPVRQYEGKGNSPFGVVDMAGNVWEWCLTDYDKRTDDVNSAANWRRVLRGGSWMVIPRLARVAYRDRYYPDYRYHDLGFRMVLNSPFR